MQTDSKDAKILDILKKNSRESFSVIGGQTGLSETAVRRRVKHMQSTGTITKFTVEHDDINSTKAIVLVSVDSIHCKCLHTCLDFPWSQSQK